MSNLSIYEKKWLDLVFEGRNQSYGAYQLRLQNPRTTIISLIIGALLFGAALGALVLAKSSPQIEANAVFDPNFIIELHEFKPPIQPKVEKEILPASSKKKDDTEEKRLINPKVVRSDESPVDVMKNVDAVKPIETTTDGDMGQGQTIKSGNAINSIPTEGSENEAVITATLDKLPEFPGGITKFLTYVGNNFREPDLSNSGLAPSKAISVIVSFVIEKDGSMTDIKVLRDPGFRLGDEAIRVLKSQKTKWKPGIKNGKPVRTLYTLPISIIPQ